MPRARDVVVCTAAVASASLAGKTRATGWQSFGKRTWADLPPIDPLSRSSGQLVRTTNQSSTLGTANGAPRVPETSCLTPPDLLRRKATMVARDSHPKITRLVEVTVHEIEN